MAAIKGLVFGRDFVFTYGPLGYLLIHAAVNKVALLAYDLFVLGSLVCLYRGLLPPRLAVPDILLLIALAVVTKICWSATAVTVLFTIECFWLWRVYERGNVLAVAGSLIAALVLFFGKVNYGLIVLFLVPAYGVALLVFRRRIQGAALLVGFPILVVLGAGFWRVDLPQYLRSGVQLVAGYQEAMYAYSPDFFWPVALAGLAIFVMAIVAIAGGRRRARRDRIMLLPLVALAALLLFKNAFLRADAEHASAFSAGLPLVLAFWCVGWRRARAVRVLLFAGLCYSITLLTLQPGSFGRPFASPVRPVWYFQQLFAAPGHETAAHLRDRLQANHPQSVFPEGVRSAIGDATVDIMPSESSLAALNGLNYRPRPVPQAYSAYNRWLDGLNARFLESSNAPDFVLYAFDRNARLDSRPAAWDESQAKAALLENYAYDSAFDVTLRWPDGQTTTSPVFLLRHSPHCRRLAPVATHAVTLDLGQTLSIPATTNLLFLKLDVARSVAGKLAANALSPAMLLVRFSYANGSNAVYEAVLPVLKDGVLINRRVETGPEVRHWLLGEAAADPAVASVCFNTFQPWAFQGPYKGELVECRLEDISSSK
jgi:hypothetical protein